MAGRFSRAWSALVGSDPAVIPSSPPEEIRANPENPSTPLSEIMSWDSFSGNTDPLSGIPVTTESALRFSAVYACVNVIAETIATLPFCVYKENDEGREKFKKHPLYRLIISQPNEFMTWFDFWLNLVSAALLRGNGYALIIRDGAMRPIGFRPLNEGECSPIYVNAGSQWYLYYNVFGKFMEPRDIIHIKCLGSNGIIGKSPIALAREGISLGLAAEKSGGAFFRNGARPSVALEHPKTLSPQALQNIRTSFESRYSGVENTGRPAILEEGMTLKQLSIDPKDAQYIETRKFQVEEIGRLYRVPLHKINSLDRSTNNNIEHQSIEFVTDTILPWVERIEQEFDAKTLAEAEKGEVATEFDVDHLLRGDSTARGNYYKSLFNVGAITPDEIRKRERMNKRGGKSAEAYLQINMAPLNDDFGKQPADTKIPTTEQPDAA